MMQRLWNRKSEEKRVRITGIEVGESVAIGGTVVEGRAKRTEVLAAEAREGNGVGGDGESEEYSGELCGSHEELQHGHCCVGKAHQTLALLFYVIFISWLLKTTLLQDKRQ